ncbi:hypothetical protein LTR10_015638 [Elasticomyces elasticus]|nr:hypothetical protein LTR10_015638 [Elasticomyces elasticus]KAK4975528.1 hypothetical protein LTR42_004739 [Elasticomyces elasticus]
MDQQPSLDAPQAIPSVSPEIFRQSSAVPSPGVSDRVKEFRALVHARLMVRRDVSWFVRTPSSSGSSFTSVKEDDLEVVLWLLGQGKMEVVLVLAVKAILWFVAWLRFYATQHLLDFSWGAPTTGTFPDKDLFNQIWVCACGGPCCVEGAVQRAWLYDALPI